tara:strand:+ start:2988 stop:3233 length:246 start_codon:yes stop_codon:yes gene_type:complete
MLDTKQKEFVKVANENGLSGTISRSDIIDLGAKTGVKKPAWLMKDHQYRVGRGEYRLPSLEETFAEAEASAESSEIVENID